MSCYKLEVTYIQEFPRGGWLGEEIFVSGLMTLVSSLEKNKYFILHILVTPT